MKFDWYAATIQDHPDNVVQRLSSDLGAEEVKIMKGGRHGYTGGYEIIRGGGVVASVLAGGENADPSAKASGSETPAFVDCVRRAYGDKHHVSRLDSCSDFDGPGSWLNLSRAARRVARLRGLKIMIIESSGKDGNEGRTLMIGSTSSAARVRIYEKGYEMAAKFPGRASEFSRDWVRVEAQLRPQKDARLSAARVTPDAAWGLSQTTRLISEHCLQKVVERIPGSRHDLGDDESSLDWMTGQYLKVLARNRNKFPDGAEFSRDLFLRAKRVHEELKTNIPVAAKDWEAWTVKTDKEKAIA